MRYRIAPLNSDDSDSDSLYYPRHAAAPRPSQARERPRPQPQSQPRPRARQQHRAYRPDTSTWPPSPSVEDDAKLAEDCEGQPPANTRGTVDQEILLERLDPPVVAPVLTPALEDRRFILVSGPITHGDDDDDDDEEEEEEEEEEAGDSFSAPALHWRRRQQSIAERGHLPAIQSPAGPPLFFTERISTPYAYTKPQKESMAPSSSDSPAHFHTPPKSPSPPRDDTFDVSDLEADDTKRLRAARQPARYSFVKSDLYRDHLRTDLHDLSSQTSPARHDSFQTLRPSKHDSQTQSPGPPASVTELPVRRRHSPPNTRTSSKANGTRPPSPPSVSAPLGPLSPGHLSVNEADWHATHSPLPIRDGVKPRSSYGRAEMIPAPVERIHACSPFQSTQVTQASSLPYPVDDCSVDVFMPPEEQYQFHNATVTSSRQSHAESPSGDSSSVMSSPRQRDPPMPFAEHTSGLPQAPSHTVDINSPIPRSYTSDDKQHELERTMHRPLDSAVPLPSCLRSTPSRHADWYSLRGCESFDICPTCYEGSFARTRFAGHFAQKRLDRRPFERICDFSSPWMRIAWLLTVQHCLHSLDLLYMLAHIAETERPCPGARDLGCDRRDWYGIIDSRDAKHIANFAVCSYDKRMLEALFPSLQGLFSRLITNHLYDRFGDTCSFRTGSRRSRTYLELLVHLDAEARSVNQPLDATRFLELVRDNAYKRECSRDKAVKRKAWYFIPSLPEFTVCEDCYDELIWPAINSRVTQSTIPHLFNKSIQLVPEEDPDLGSSCCLYSPRMRRIWDTSTREDDFLYLTRKALERRRVESSLSRERTDIMKWMLKTEKGSRQWQRVKSQLNDLNKEWTVWE
ncbi:hypothetical protein IAQ61_008860 [Plenodomus lingam]|uniref:Predicted protein n=1 Tax=Leptosphaeria maculans (strain JN3 / isolate v23.1.3 / race Av1-4-5-6-7-8) TaxID=985895 RepID=E4ZPA8_LEPMJ|nr:predicted protein [Plenodomus lingam JN3]KAH9864915.1 hypothetical protein IAQ61_008860 [Plenodomus lingam]CBX93133.1 predicted protein [Plenodomus lingam JN3]